MVLEMGTGVSSLGVDWCESGKFITSWGSDGVAKVTTTTTQPPVLETQVRNLMHLYIRYGTRQNNIVYFWNGIQSKVTIWIPRKRNQRKITALIMIIGI